MKKINYLDSIISPIITEKATNQSEQNKVTFKIHKSIEMIFKVTVVKINTINKKGKNKMVRGKLGKKSGFKKALVTLKKGQSIDLSLGA